MFAKETFGVELYKPYNVVYRLLPKLADNNTLSSAGIVAHEESV